MNILFHFVVPWYLIGFRFLYFKIGSERGSRHIQTHHTCSITIDISKDPVIVLQIYTKLVWIAIFFAITISNTFEMAISSNDPCGSRVVQI